MTLPLPCIMDYEWLPVLGGYYLFITTIRGVCYTMGYLYISVHERMIMCIADSDTWPGKLTTIHLVTLPCR